MQEKYYVTFSSPTIKRKTIGLLAVSPEDARNQILAQSSVNRIRYVQSAREMAEQQADYHARIKAQVVEAYGGKCQCPGGCNEAEPWFLTIDHIHNDGGEDREAKGHAHHLYLWLCRNGFPTDRYRLLCYNCNLGRAKRKDKRCPHELKN